MTISLEEILAADNLPSLPEVANRVLTLAQDCNSDVSALAEAVKADPAISAKVLRTANSALFGRQYKVNSVHAAIPVLGETLLRTLVLGFSLPKYDQRNNLEPAFRLIWRRAVIQAVAAEELAEAGANEDPSLYFVCGLLQDIGSLAILGANGMEYADKILSKTSHQNQIKKEQSLFGYSHVDVSVGLCSKWQLNETAIGAIQQHHENLNLLRSTKSRDESTLVEALKVASLCANYIQTESDRFGRNFHGALSRLFDIGENDTEQFFARIRARVSDLETNLYRRLECMPPIDEIMGKAKTAIEEVAIQGHLEAARARCHRQQLEKEVSEDPLTGACNRRGLESQMERLSQLCIHREESLGILFFDLDNFKPHNDSLGHEAGDQALKRFVEVLRKSVRSEDLIVRYGGDEFVVVCMGPCFDELNSIARRICDDFKRQNAATLGTSNLTASVGGIHCSHAALPSSEASKLLREADKNMYASKRRGGNRITIERLHSRECHEGDVMKMSSSS